MKPGRLRFCTRLHRYFSTTRPSGNPGPTTDAKKYSASLLLPRTGFPLWADPTKNENTFRDKTCDRLYRWQQENATGSLFVLHDGPPYANGDLHMGHALNKILKDIINRFHVSLGRKVHYIPGWDCHGLPIENRALQEIGKDALNLPAPAIRSAAKATATRQIASQRDQFRQLGIMADWSPNSTYRTLDHSYEVRQLRIFQKMVEKGLIYRRYRPVHYSPSSRSALAEAELTYKEDHVSHSVYISFEVEDGMSDRMRCILSHHPRACLLVWTTTPWTLTANMGIAVHPDCIYVVARQQNDADGVVIMAKDRSEDLANLLGPIEPVAELPGSDLIGTSYKPLFSGPKYAELRIISATHVTSDSGTGLVHCAPAHGFEDYNAFRSLKLLESRHLLCHVDGAGTFTSSVADVVGEEAAEELIGKKVLGDGSKAIVELLKKMGRVVKVERFKHKYPYDWRTNEPIIVTATSQWFANLDNIKDRALDALKDVSFFPPASRNRLESFIRSRSEWCISRQRVWGVPIPALHHIPSDRAILDSTSLEHILAILEKKGVAYWWDGPVEEFVPPSLHHDSIPIDEGCWRKGTDTMDVWFDSGTSWSLLDPPDHYDHATENRRSFRADVCLEGSDQHRGWFQSLLLTAVAATSSEQASPYGTLITHGMVLDQDGRKMSKSLGNVISPMTIVNGGKDKKLEPTYGADVLRLWAATVEYWRDMAISPTVLAQAAESMRKIRNSARFILGNIGDVETRPRLKDISPRNLGLGERYVMHELYTLEKVALEGYATYNFPKVMSALTHFANVTLSSLYFDITKDCLYANSRSSPERQAIVMVLDQILTTMTSVLAPVLPHLAEEISYYARRKSEQGRDVGPSVFHTIWTPLESGWEDPQAQRDMERLLQVRKVILSLLERARGHKQLKSSLEAEVDLILPDGCDGAVVDLIRREERFLKTLFIVSDVCLIDEGALGTSSPEWVHSDSIAVPGCEEEMCVRIRQAKHSKCPRCWTYTRRENDVLCPRCIETTEISINTL